MVCYSIVQCSVVQYSIVQYSISQHVTLYYSIVQRSIVQYSTTAQCLVAVRVGLEDLLYDLGDSKNRVTMSRSLSLFFECLWGIPRTHLFFMTYEQEFEPGQGGPQEGGSSIFQNEIAVSRLFMVCNCKQGWPLTNQAAHVPTLGPHKENNQGISKNTVRGYCSDIPRFEESLNS